MTASLASSRPFPLSGAAVLRVREDCCEVWDGSRSRQVAFAPVFPTPRLSRVFPGHLVAVAAAADDRSAIIWRWFDAVVLAIADHGEVRLWEPGHGELVARLRDPSQELEPGSRVYASSGLPGAQWWVAGPVTDGPRAAEAEFAAISAFFSAEGLWASIFDS